MVDSPIKTVEDEAKEHSDTIFSVTSHYGNKTFDYAATKAITNAYFSSGRRAVGSAGSAALDYSTGVKGVLGRGLNLTRNITVLDDASKGTLLGGVVGGTIGYLKGGGQSNKEENVGKGITSGVVGGLATAGIIAGGAAVAGFIVGAPVTVPFAVVAVVGIGVGYAVSKANDWFYKNVPAVKDFENSVGAVGTGIGDIVTGKWGNLGKDFSDAGKEYLNAYKDTNKWITKTVPAIGAGEKAVGKGIKKLGQAAGSFWNWLTGKKSSNSKSKKKTNSRDDYEKNGRLKIQRGASYSGGETIALSAGAVTALAQTISSKSSDYANKLMAINNSIDQEIEDAKREVKQWAMGKLGQYNYLTADDVDEILSSFDITYDAGAVSNSNNKIKTLAQNLSHVSSGLQAAAKTITETDASIGQGFKTDSFGGMSNYQLGFK